jgi:hypothetical protein
VVVALICLGSFSREGKEISSIFELQKKRRRASVSVFYSYVESGVRVDCFEFSLLHSFRGFAIAPKE